jgi:hypothetical protein
MFSSEYREQLRADLLRRGERDKRISGVAITGSAAVGKEDDWSDIDLAFGVRDGVEVEAVLSDWTAHMYEREQAVDHLDVRAGAWIYRVFVVTSTLQVDLAFVPESEFRALAPSFQLVSGKAHEAVHVPAPDAGGVIRYAWLYALHVRSCIARAKYWQAEFMISGMRDQVLTLACLRHGLPAVHGRGLDELPLDLRSSFEDTLVRQMVGPEMMRAFQAVTRSLLQEMRLADAKVPDSLQEVLLKLCVA